MSAESEAVMREMVEGGHAVLIRLQSLGEAEAEQLLDTLQVPVSPAVRQDVSRYAGGNPLFLLETVKHLLETGQLEVGVPGRMLPPGRVRQLLERRLVRLSQPALQAARAAAVLQSDFNLDLVAQVLGAPLLDLLAAWEELEVTQIVHGPRFSHDLVYEAVLAGIPESVRELLHRRAARALAGEEAPPSRVARHWLEGGDHRQAATWFLRAAEAAEVGALFREAVAFYEQAVRSLEVCGQDQAARDIRARALTTPAALT